MPEKTHRQNSRNHRTTQTVAFALVIVLGFGAVTALSRWIDDNKPRPDAKMEEERLYLTGNTARRMSLGFNGLMADWYWLRSLQYVGRKLVAHEGDLRLDDLGPLDLRLLYPLLDNATTLDPQFMAPYSYGAVVLPAINEENAIKLIQKGIEQNPGAWRLYQHLGYIYWKRNDYQKAAESYAEGAKIPGAPHWMREMSARMTAEGGSHKMAKEIYARLYEEAEDQALKELLARRLLQVDSFEERDEIRRAMESFKERNSRCAQSWTELARELRAIRLPNGKPLRMDATGAPIDPAGTAYVLKSEKCEVAVNPESKVPMK